MGRQGRVGGPPPQGPVPVLAGLMDGNGCSIGTHILSYKPVSTADWAYMKAPVPRPTLRLVDKVSRSCGYTPGKVTGQRATVKAEMNGLTPGLDRHPPSR